jgi:hypothetical protein
MHYGDLNEPLPESDRFAVQYQLEIELKMTLTTMTIAVLSAVTPSQLRCGGKHV